MEITSNIKSFGELIRELRKEKGVSLYDLEKAVSVSPSYISRLERGNRYNPTIYIVGRLSGYFQIPITVIEELYPEMFQGSSSNDKNALDELIMKNEYVFAGVKANIEIKLCFQRIIKKLETYMTSESVSRSYDALMLDEIDKLKEKVYKSA